MWTVIAIAFVFILWAPYGFGQTPCLYNPVTGRYQLCYHVTAGGTCAHFGAVCTYGDR